jgi:hypothetical protein
MRHSVVSSSGTKLSIESDRRSSGGSAQYVLSVKGDVEGPSTPRPKPYVERAKMHNGEVCISLVRLMFGLYLYTNLTGMHGHRITKASHPVRSAQLSVISLS